MDAFASTCVPVSIGVAGRVELPYRIRVTLGVGFMPGAYLDTINGTASAFGWYDNTTGDLIEAALKNSLIVHPRVGWRPSPSLGFHFAGGYQVAALGGSLSGAEVIAAVTGQEVPEEVELGRLEMEAPAVDHLLTIEAGYEIVVKERLVTDLSLGGMFTVASSSKLTPQGSAASGPLAERSNAAVDALASVGETYLNDTLTSYGHTPTVGVMVGYRFR